MVFTSRPAGSQAKRSVASRLSLVAALALVAASVGSSARGQEPGLARVGGGAPPPSEISSLAGPTWLWDRLESPAGTVVVEEPWRYSLEFSEADSLFVQADCRAWSTPVTVKGNRLSIRRPVRGQAKCPEGSLDGRLLGALGEAATVERTDDVLTIGLEDGKGALRFVRASRLYVSGAGFRLALPEAWRTGSWTATEGDGPSGEGRAAGASREVAFSFVPSARGADSRPLMTLAVFSEAGWEAARKGPTPGEVVLKTAGRVVTASFPPSNPYPVGSPDHASYDSMLAAARQALSTLGPAGAAPPWPVGRLSATGAWSYSETASNREGRTYDLRLSPSGSAALAAPGAWPGGRPIIEHGRWKQAGTKVEVVLTLPGAQNADEPLTLSFDGEALVATAWDKARYGKVPPTFRRAPKGIRVR